MPKFDEASVGGDLDYDFSKMGQPGVSGTIPEPSRIAVKKFFKNVQAAFKDLKLVDNSAPDQASPDSIVQTMNSIDDEELFDTITEKITENVAALCGGERDEDGKWSGGSPTYDQIVALKYRYFMMFFGYIMENLMNPELSRPGTNRSQVRLTSV